MYNVAAACDAIDTFSTVDPNTLVLVQDGHQ